MTPSDQAPGPTRQPDSRPELTSRTRRSGPGKLTFAGLGVVVLLAGTFAYLALRYHDQHGTIVDVRATGLPAEVPTSLASLMGLSPVPTRPAPNFTLVDQDGHTMSLGNFKGRAVVLEFMDSHCVDICPIVSQEFVDAYHDLGAAASRVVFVAVNVNPYHVGVTDVAAFSSAHQLSTIPSWHFFTGPVPALREVWHDYGIDVEAPSPDADVVHSSIVYFIDQDGRERYLSNPTDEHTAAGTAYLPAGQLASWGRGIALVERSLA